MKIVSDALRGSTAREFQNPGLWSPTSRRFGPPYRRETKSAIGSEPRR